MPTTIDAVNSEIEREPLIRPFGFKGGYLTELWQTVSLLENTFGHRAVGLGTQSVLWSDAAVFGAHSESGGNVLMYALTEYALQLIRGATFTSPVDLLEAIFDEVYHYGQTITRNPDLRKTFVLNALVSVDNAAWLLYASENGMHSFDDLIPESYAPALSHRHEAVAGIPLISYAVPVEEIEATVEQGYFFLKIKMGQSGTQGEMLEKDTARLSAIHEAVGGRRTPHTSDGKLIYYLDANGRYQEKETLLRFLDHAKQIGAYEQIAMIEEPFPEEYEVDVDDLEIRIAADESAHTDEDTRKRINMGYSAVALKPIAKTLSMTMKIAQVAHEHNVPCFCADLTVNPILVEWNKNVAARLTAFPEIGMGLLETNGHQNYDRWEAMQRYHPLYPAEWMEPRDGVFRLTGEFYTTSGGIFEPSLHYENLFAMME